MENSVEGSTAMSPSNFPIKLLPTYEETLEWLLEQLPMFHRVGPAAYRQGLEGIQTLCRYIGHPERRMGKVIHVAGTNGKGSVAHMLAAILQAHGYRTGLFTSPHLWDFRERIRINGQPIEEERIVHWVSTLQQCLDYPQPSFFEFTTAMAFAHFAESNLDFVVIETGLGGRLDSTNIVQPVLTLITHIDWDHMNLLGNTLPLIAAEKAGIMKRGVPLILGRTQIEEIQNIFVNKAHELRCLIYNSDQCYRLRKVPLEDSYAWRVERSGKTWSHLLHCDLLGDYQAENLGQTLMAMDILRQMGEDLDDDKILQGLSNVSGLTGLQGRWQTWGHHPIRITDVAHNQEGIRAIVNQVQSTLLRLSKDAEGDQPQAHWVLGMVSDKDHDSVLALLPKAAHYYFCAPSIPRALRAEDLAEKAKSYDLTGSVWPSVDHAWRAAVSAAGKFDLVIATGSFFVVAEINHCGQN
ncbi:MAG: bifunctional folylpolyglutamate synthase/dihydrofolate synthase [Sphingomonadales bacterium]|nr:bifunctional folylpolyglutamate synthase/dihydrofolate synthase [Sphingomonadales bacterium]MBM3924143.1 bifunctional folylpolyglutamate synthase/dihydrofolate synthase [Sphingomonadales bacterium]